MITPNKLIGAELVAKMNEIEAKVPGNFGQQCTVKKCGKAKMVRKDVFMKRVEAVGGDVACLMKHYHCQKCRKSLNVDMIGNPKVSGGNAKVITLEDLEG